MYIFKEKFKAKRLIFSKAIKILTVFFVPKSGRGGEGRRDAFGGLRHLQQRRQEAVFVTRQDARWLLGPEGGDYRIYWYQNLINIKSINFENENYTINFSR